MYVFCFFKNFNFVIFLLNFVLLNLNDFCYVIYEKSFLALQILLLFLLLCFLFLDKLNLVHFELFTIVEGKFPFLYFVFCIYFKKKNTLVLQ